MQVKLYLFLDYLVVLSSRCRYGYLNWTTSTHKMVSPAELMSRVGVGGRLVPFFQSVCVYFAAGGGPPGPAAVAAKCAPLLCLLLLLLLHRAYSPRPDYRYVRLVCWALSLSALGDALLVWPAQLVAGMAAFGAAHACYVRALRLRPAAPLLAAAAFGATALFLPLLAPRGPLRLAVPLYALLLATTAWRALARALHSPPEVARYRRCAAAGAVLFLASDAALGYSLWGGAGAGAAAGAGGAGWAGGTQRALVMAPYYLAQLGLALSALEPAP